MDEEAQLNGIENGGRDASEEIVKLVEWIGKYFLWR
jgi:hypothetical protein